MIHIFDLDGTLLDSMPLWSQLAVTYLSSKNQYPDRAYLLPLKSMTLAMAAQYFHQTLLPYEQTKDIEQALQAQITHAYAHTLSLKPRAYAYVQSVIQAGETACIATATSKPLANLALQRLKLDKLPLYTVDDIGYTKDSPQFYRSIAPQGSLTVYEDALHAMKGAKKAGAIIIAIEDPAQTNDQTAILATCDLYWQHWPAIPFSTKKPLA